MRGSLQSIAGIKNAGVDKTVWIGQHRIGPQKQKSFREKKSKNNQIVYKIIINKKIKVEN